MEIEFANRRLERCYHEPSRAFRTWEEPVARRYIQRINTIRRTGRFEELYTIPPFRLHPLRGQRSGLYAIDLSGRWRLIIYPVTAVRVRIEEVSNHYGD